MEIIPLGDTAFTIRFGQDFSVDPGEAVQSLLEARERLRAAAIPGVIEFVPAYNSIGVFFDPAALRENVRDTIAFALANSGERANARAFARYVEIPVCYEGPCALDLEDVAKRSEITPAEVARLHTAAEYTVVCLGFMPGFGYLAGLSEKLATPRRASPRKQVPAGSVAIGGSQTGVYPTNSPGGWNIIGRTNLRMFEAHRDPPAILRAGDRVRFRAISHEEFEGVPHESH